MAISEPEEDSYSNEFGTEDIQRNDDIAQQNLCASWFYLQIAARVCGLCEVNTSKVNISAP